MTVHEEMFRVHMPCDFLSYLQHIWSPAVTVANVGIAKISRHVFIRGICTMQEFRVPNVTCFMTVPLMC